MPRPVLVVGLSGRNPDAGWNALLDGRTIVARTRWIAQESTPPRWTVAHSYDELFEQEQLAGIENIIADDIVRRSDSTDIAYLVPGPGWIGDATVSALSELTSIEIVSPGQIGAHPAHAQVSDALLLAQAQERAPFDSGSQPLDATVPSVIYNWHATRVTELARARLGAVYGVTHLPVPDQFGTLVVPARDVLDGPPSFAALKSITARLRQPDGCPWDRKQTHDSLLDDFASEVAEYAEAVRAGVWPHAAEELGDVLLNILMQTQIGTEADHFRIEDVLTSINAKLVRRHPHVFAGVEANSPEEVHAVWSRVKQQEKASRTTSAPDR
ncbi:MAG: hypothetical protein M3439_07215 [Chloroflexota bacterium]|nr:hypothetical protein [Chloroflexota bacterium]